jgi:hypothetical protein
LWDVPEVRTVTCPSFTRWYRIWFEMVLVEIHIVLERYLTFSGAFEDLRISRIEEHTLSMDGPPDF